jgi:hypothetical protein
MAEVSAPSTSKAQARSPAGGTRPASPRAALRRLAFAFAAAVALSSTTARAEGTPGDDVERAQVEALRAQMANHVHLRAMNLLDELVLAMKGAPPVHEVSSVAIADVTGPFGYGAGFEALLENHLTDLLIAHPDTRLRPVHCAACRAVAVHATAKATVIARGVDQPDLLARLGETGATHALFVDVEAEGADVVLRTQLVALSPGLPIVWARTLTSSTASDALLRSDEHLVTAREAREEYLAALRQRGRLTPIARVALLQFAPNDQELFDDFTGALLPPALPVAPLYWVAGGAELAFTNNREWLGSIVVGGSYAPFLYTSAMVQARFARLLGSNVASLVWPNVYLVGGVSLTGLVGNEATKLRDPIGTITVPNEDTMHAWPSVHVGVDVRLGQRLGAALTLEQAPTLYNRASIGAWGPAWPLQANAVGGEVNLWF